MVGNSCLLTSSSTVLRCFSDLNSGSTSAGTNQLVNVKIRIHVGLDLCRVNSVSSSSRSQLLCFAPDAQSAGGLIHDEDNKESWESCKRALDAFGFSDEEEEKILGKAYGQIPSPYWGEQRKEEVPRVEVLTRILNYLKDVGLTDEDVGKVVKKFPEVLGCDLESELTMNVQVLEREWGIKGKTLRNLLLRNPKVLGYNVDCKGDCMAQCTRCWVRF